MAKEEDLMHRTTRYAAGLCMLGSAAVGLSALAFLLAIDGFASKELTTKVSPGPSPAYSDTDPHYGQMPLSHLVGTIDQSNDNKFDVGSSQGAPVNGEWVEVTDAVNMRSGPSSANPVFQVQLKGAHLRVASRNGKWIEVIDPNTGRDGWVYERFVKPIKPTSRQADLVRDSSG